MSHFVCLALLNVDSPISRESVNVELDRILAPFSEHIEVDEYDEECWCRGMIAKRDADQLATVEYGKSIGELRDEFWAMDEKDRPEWDEHTKDFVALAEKHEKAHASYNKPDPTCDSCSGTGTRQTTYNPDSKWDWYQIGGRWTGLYSAYDPAKDPNNVEECDLCKGTGMREGWGWIDDEGVHYKDKWATECKGCNGCQGTGKRTKWPTEWKDHEGDILPTKSVLEQYEEKGAPFALLTPEGEWVERGQMGWWATVSNEKEQDEWNASAKSVLEKYKNTVAVVVDCHI